MAPSTTPRLRILSVGGNPLSAFLSWRLQATHACDMTLVWKTNFDTVYQYGVSFKSSKYGNERFKPHAVVRTPEDASTMPGGFDYVLLSVKALPDVYDLASIIESVVTPRHTCILVNTTNALGTEAYLETRFPTNVVLSLVSGIALSQLGSSEFEHTGGEEIWVGSAIENPNVPASIQYDMADALALTLSAGNVICHVSLNIRQQQWERVLGPIAFHPLSVLMDCPNNAALMERPGCRQLINDLIDELISVAEAQKCTFPVDFKQKTIEQQLNAAPTTNIMYQDFAARRPLEIETFLGSPIKAGKALNVLTPHLNTLYPILSHMNQQNQARQQPLPSPGQAPRPVPPSQRGAPGPYGQGRGPPPRGPGNRGGLDPSIARRGPPSQRNMPPNGCRPPPGGNGDYATRPVLSRRNSIDDDLEEEFAHIALYEDMIDGNEAPPPQDEIQRRGPPPPPSATELSLREREVALREREIMLKEHERAAMARQHGGGGGRRKMPGSRSRSVYGDDDDDGDDDIFADSNVPPMPPVDVDNFDMMSITSRRNRRMPSASQRSIPDVPLAPSRGRHSLLSRSNRNRTSAASARLMNDVPGLHDPITDNVLLGYSSNRYGNVDRAAMTSTSRANSMSSQRVDVNDIRDNHAFGGGAYPPMPNGNGGAYPPMPNGNGGAYPPMPNGNGGAYPPMPSGGGGGAYPPMPNGRRMSSSPAATHANGYIPRNGHPQGGYRPEGPPNRTPSKHPGQNGYPHQVEQRVSDGVRQPPIMKGPSSNTVRSTTGSASASLGSGSASTGGDTSAYSSSSSLEKRLPHGVAVA